MMYICTKYGIDILIISGSYGGHKPHTTYNIQGTTYNARGMAFSSLKMFTCQRKLQISVSLVHE